MKKMLLFLITIAAILSFSSCNNDDFDLENGVNTHPTKVRWYGVKTTNTNDVSTRGVSDKAKLWNPQAGIAIKFINNPADADMIERIKTIASEWEKYAGIRFNYVDSDLNASVRIAFDWNGNDWLTWSYTGSDARFVKNQNKPTAVFGGLQYQDEEQFKGDVLRVFGQILGLEYEQRHQDWSFWRDEVKLQRYWEDMFDGMDMDWDEIRDYVFTPMNSINAVSPTQTTEIDELSIMAWPYYTRTQTTKLIANVELSEGDKTFIATLYPKDNSTLPTIQQAWIDAGYFKWENASKTKLRITPLGAKQETLPDVSDGEQLTDASYMFSSTSGAINIALKKAPSFNTSNIQNFTYMFLNATNLSNVPQYDTSRGKLFSGMFYGCTSLKEIPNFDTSNGKEFSLMFGSTAISKAPSLNTSNGEYFAEMFYNCIHLKEVPLYDLSSATVLDGFFKNCKSLKDIPAFDTSNGVDFGSMFYNTAIVEAPLLNTSNALVVAYMFRDCKYLEKVPSYDLSQAIQLMGMFYGCTSLKKLSPIYAENGSDFFEMFKNSGIVEAPEIHMSPNGASFWEMFKDCEYLEKVPLYDTSTTSSLEGMFAGCKSLKSIPNFDTSNVRYFNSMFENSGIIEAPLINTSKGTKFTSMFKDCLSLKTVPPYNTSNGWDFEFMFENCSSLLQKPNLIMPNEDEIYAETKDMYKGTPFEKL